MGEPLDVDRLQAEKMRALGEFAMGIAHDFNNVLTGVLAQLALARHTLAEGDLERTRSQLVDVEGSVLRGADLVRKLLGFSRKQPLSLAPTAVRDLVEGAGVFLRALLPANIEMVWGEQSDGWVLADPVRVEHILINLVVNARDAMPKGGVLTLGSRFRTLTPEFTDSHKWGSPGRYHAIYVEDTGEGIPPALLDRVLDPFVTTKPAGRGTGLGLAMAYGLMKQHRGWIDIQSSPGVGTTVELLMPALSHGGMQDAVGAGATRRGSERVLIAEDDDAIRNALAGVLKRHGYTVRTARDGFEALAVLQFWPEAELVIADISMPQMGGIELRNAIRDRRLDTGVLLTSGLGPDGVRELPGTEGETEVLWKPWTAEELLAAVRVALGDQPSTEVEGVEPGAPDPEPPTPI